MWESTTFSIDRTFWPSPCCLERELQFTSSVRRQFFPTSDCATSCDDLHPRGPGNVSFLQLADLRLPRPITRDLRRQLPNHELLNQVLHRSLRGPNGSIL